MDANQSPQSKLSATQNKVVAWLRAHPGVKLERRQIPGDTVRWSDQALESTWRKENAGKPVRKDCVGALVVLGVLAQERKRRAGLSDLLIWKLSDSFAYSAVAGEVGREAASPQGS